MVQDLTAKQLKAIHLGGQQGVHIPTLEEFLKYDTHSALRKSFPISTMLSVYICASCQERLDPDLQLYW